MATIQEIKMATQRVINLVKTLTETKAMVKGSFSTVYRRCGKPTCWCIAREQKGHVCTRITWTEKGISRTKTVNEKDRVQLKQAVAAYHEYRLCRRKLRSEEKLLEKLLDTHELTIIKIAAL